MLKLSIFALFLCLISSNTGQNINQDIQPPLWAPHFSVFVFERITLKDNTFGSNSGKLWVDYDKNNLRIQRNDSKFEATCQAVMPGWSTPCTQLVNNGTKYVIFPTNNLCCQCCKISQPTCYFWKRDWLSNSTYAGMKVINGETYYEWKHNIGNTTYNYLETSVSPRVPKQLQKSDSTYLLDFVAGYNTSEIPESIFDIPSYCRGKCPKSDFCPGTNENQNFFEI